MMGGYGYGYGPMMGGGGWLGWILMMGFWVLVIVGAILLIVWLVRSSRHAPSGTGPVQPAQPAHDEAMTIARRRLANGEITADQFEDIRKTLQG